MDKVFTFGMFDNVITKNLIHYNCAPAKSLLLCVPVYMDEEWATDEVLIYTTLEGLRCSKVFHLDLSSNRSKITSVYEEIHPE